MRKATGYTPPHPHSAIRPSLSPWSITCQCARNENTNKLIFGLVKFNFFTSIQCPQKRPQDSAETSKSNSTTWSRGERDKGIANGTCDCCDCWLTIKRFRFQVIACKWHKHKTKSEYLWHWIGLALMANSNSKFRSWTFQYANISFGYSKTRKLHWTIDIFHSLQFTC